MPSASLSQDSTIQDSAYNPASTYTFPSKTIEVHDTIALPWKICTVEVSRLHSGQTGYAGERIENDNMAYDFFFLTFLTCFFLIAFVFAKGKKNIALMSNVLFSSKSRQSIFFETTGKDLRDKFLLVLQFAIIMSVFFFIWQKDIYNDSHNAEINIVQSILIILAFFVVIFIYMGYKWLSTWIISKIFFNENSFENWKETYTAMVCLGGIAIFIPVLLLYYIPIGQFYDYILIILCFFISRLLIIHKSFVLFFPKINQILYLILYLCTQEIIPLFLLYKGLMVLFNMMVDKTTTLWI